MEVKMKKPKIKWNKKNDTFTIDRQSLAWIVDFAYYPEWLKPKDRPQGYEEFRKVILSQVNLAMVCWSKDRKFLKSLMKNAKLQTEK